MESNIIHIFLKLIHLFAPHTHSHTRINHENASRTTTKITLIAVKTFISEIHNELTKR